MYALLVKHDDPNWVWQVYLSEWGSACDDPDDVHRLAESMGLRPGEYMVVPCDCAEYGYEDEENLDV